MTGCSCRSPSVHHGVLSPRAWGIASRKLPWCSASNLPVWVKSTRDARPSISGTSIQSSPRCNIITRANTLAHTHAHTAAGPWWITPRCALHKENETGDHYYVLSLLFDLSFVIPRLMQHTKGVQGKRCLDRWKESKKFRQVFEEFLPRTSGYDRHNSYIVMITPAPSLLLSWNGLFWSLAHCWKSFLRLINKNYIDFFIS